MYLNSICQVELKDVNLSTIDATIVSSGYETRARHFSEKVHDRLNNKFVLAFEDHQSELARSDNDHFFSISGFKKLTIDGDDEDNEVIVSLLKKIISRHQQVVRIIIDYSCMTRVWYATILNFIKHLDTSKTIELFFVYSESKYVKPPESESLNRHVGPISGYSHLSIPDKPTALVIGLGYEKMRAFGLKEYIDAEPFVFYTDDSEGNAYTTDVIEKNKDLLKSIPAENIFKYPLHNLEFTASVLFKLCEDLSDKFRIILASCGPKPFTMLCLLASLNYEFIDVWRISPGKERYTVDRLPSGKILMLSAVFKNAQ